MKTGNYLNTQYSVTVEFGKSADYVFSHLINLSGWWPEEFLSEGLGPGVEFILRTGDSHYSKNKVLELVPDERLVWLTTESIRKPDNYDWSGTKMIFELSPKGNDTLLKFTYDGVVPEHELSRLKDICDYCIKISLYNFVESINVTTEVAISRKEVFEIITREVSKWWGGKDLAGNTSRLNDEFIVNHPGAHYSKQKLVELIPEQKVVWLVTESRLDWLENDKAEWTGTKMIFELTGDGDKTEINFRHDGLVPAKECYERVNAGWNMIITDFLYNYIMEGKVAEQLFG
ncbi:MAG: SRPBCC domain-containing protein [Bacteroidetes bacterium]|nr:SRPBCC domain-containing protein [Bacteroidota bacterium]